MRRCPTCKQAALMTGTSEEVFAFTATTVTVTASADLCPACGEALVSAGELGRIEAAAARALVEAGTQGGDVFRFLRKSVGLPARVIARLFDVSPDTVSRWENGERAVPRVAMALLGALIVAEHDGRPSLRAQLEALATASPAAGRELRIEVPPPTTGAAEPLERIARALETLAAERH
jgi:HTH-type transcriptional regulator / antitoxin MqsA